MSLSILLISRPPFSATPPFSSIDGLGYVAEAAQVFTPARKVTLLRYNGFTLSLSYDPLFVPFS